LVARIVDEHRGSKPVEQGEGDSFVAAFPRAIEAARFAMGLQRAIAADSWRDGAVPRVRIGVHTGAARLQDGLYRGETLNRCARIRSLAYGGQVLLSSSTAELVVGDLGDSMFLKDVGLHRLRDLSRPEHLRQLCHPDLTVAFPPLLSLDRLPNNLPVQVTNFVGRDAELGEVAALLTDAHLVTLTGAGGAGKTRLALQIAAGVVDRYPDGAWLVDLAPVTDPQMVAPAVASVLDVGAMPLGDLLSALEGYVRDQEMLLVIDNCEHLVDACATVIERLIGSCAQLRVLATSREPIGVAGEVTYRVPSLSLPEGDVTQCASVELFAARAVAVRPSFRVTVDNAEAIAAVCRRLDGLPLAIELAAARCRALSPEQIAVQLGDRFSLLTGGARTALPRQRTLEASVGWSVDLLGADERTLLRRLSVFAGSFSLEAAEAVGGFDLDESWRVVDLLTSLVDKSLVQIDEHGDTLRYRLLETIRHFAGQQLLAANESTTVRDAHARYYAGFAHMAAPGLVGADAKASYAAFDRESDNIRSALAWLVHNRDVQPALELAAPLRLVWARIATPDVLQNLEELLALEGGDRATRAHVMLCAAAVAWFLGDLDRHIQLVEHVDQIAEALDDETLSAFVTLNRGWHGLLVGDPNTEALLIRARDDLRSREEYYWSSDALDGLGTATLMRGDLVQSDALLAEAVADARTSRNPVALVRALALHARTAMERGGLNAAEQMLDEVDALHADTADLSFALLAATARAWIKAAVGCYEDALAQATDVANVSRRSGLPITLFWATSVALITERALGHRARQRALIDELETNLGLPWAHAWGGAVRAELALAEDDVKAARATIDDALATANDQPFAGYARSRCLLTRARVLRAQDDATAEDTAYLALSTSATAGLRLETIEALELLASFAAGHEKIDDAGRLLGAATQARTATGCPAPPVLHDEITCTTSILETKLGTERLNALLEEGATLDLTAAQTYAARGRGTRGRATTGWQSLTPAETQVVKLVAEGLKNAEIAQRLFTSSSTVKTHLAHIFTKLGTSTRTELAARAAERDRTS
jgi:predicted ATPase/DNA-binding CsgD family transcriptional regulator